MPVGIQILVIFTNQYYTYGSIPLGDYLFMKEFSVIILGSSAALPYKNRNVTAQVVRHSGRLFLIDCGEGTQMQIQRFRIKSRRINHIFISHLHGDHYYGLIGLVSSFHLLGRTEDLHIYGPEPLESVITLQLDVSLTVLGYKLFFHAVPADKPSVIYEDDRLLVRSFPTIHRIPTTGFIFSEKQLPRHINLKAAELFGVPYTEFADLKQGFDFLCEDGQVVENKDLTIEPEKARSYVFCADTVFHEPLAELFMGCDLLYHEATFMNSMAEVAAAKLHSTAEQAARIALIAGARKLLIGHFSARYDNLQPLLEEAKAVFPETCLVEEGTIYPV